MEDNKLKDGDYILEEGAAWLEVDKFAIRIHKTDEGVVVDVYANGSETNETIASTYAFTSEAEAILEEEAEAAAVKNQANS